MLQILLKHKNISEKLKLLLNNTITHKTLTHALETGRLTKRDRKQLSIFERKIGGRGYHPVAPRPLMYGPFVRRL
jgi:hypothetical protein